MFNILNGKFFLRNNSTIVNKRGIVEKQQFDETKCSNFSGIEKIFIDSSIADVNVLVSESSTIKAHFYGEALIDGKVDFDFRIVNHELKIMLKIKCNCYNVSLKLDVTIPKKKFKAIEVKTISSDITLSDGILTHYLKVKSLRGYFISNASFENGSISTTSGNIELYVDATTNISINISTVSGDVLTELNNIGRINVYCHSMTGAVTNLFMKGIGYGANVVISTLNGSILIR